MKKITVILMALVIGFASCSDDDDDPVETCEAYALRYEKKFDAVDEEDLEEVFELLEEFITNLPEGCDDELDLD